MKISQSYMETQILKSTQNIKLAKWETSEIRNAQTCKAYKNGRKCDNSKCKGDLEDTIINFGENLNDPILNIGYAHVKYNNISKLFLVSLKSMKFIWNRLTNS